MKKTYVVDANAPISLLMNSPAADQVSRLLQEADRSNNPLLISAANWGEIFYLSWQRHGERVARHTLAELSRLPFRVVPVDLAQALKAAEIKATNKIPYVDCLAAALASLSRATLVTSDRDFEKLGKQFPILWIAPS
jgi:predicted nucleic acid-binding protein